MTSFDDILDHIGHFGMYQKTLVFLIYAPVLFVAFQAMSYVFTSAVPKHRCFVATCDTDVSLYLETFLNWTTSWSKDQFSSCDTYGKATSRNSTYFGSLGTNKLLAVDDFNGTACQEFKFDRNTSVPCDTWIFDKSTYSKTAVTDFQLVCDDSSLVFLAESAYMVGVMLGGLAFGIIADKFGRKNAIMYGVIVASTAASLLPLVPNYSMYLAMKVIIGLSCQGIYMSTFVLSMELVGKSKRALCGILVIIIFCFGEIGLGILAFYIRDWKILQLTISLPMFIFISYFWIIPESPRWLISRKEFAKADEILEKIAISNKRTMPYEMIKSMCSNMDNANKDKPADSIAQTLKELCLSPRLRWRTLNVAFNWIMITLAYYGITLSTPKLGGNEFVNFLEVSAIELPAYIYCILALDRYGRRRPLCLGMIVGGAASFCTYFVPSTPQYLWLSITLAMIAKFGASAAYAIIYVFTAELFPTTIRNNIIGFCALVGHIGGVVAPYVAYLGTYNPVLPMMIYGLSSLIAGLAALTVPETLNQKLPDTIQEAIDFGR